MDDRISQHYQFTRYSMAGVIKKVVLRQAMNFVSLDGLYLEFGVSNGFSINYIAKLNPHKTIYGFDCWQGLPEDWYCAGDRPKLWPKGSFTTNEVLPEVRYNVKLVSGLFEDSLPNFVKSVSNIPAAFVHIDSDLYSSAKTIFKYFGNKFVPGTVIVFDEYMQDSGEKQAFNEWLQESNSYAYNLCETISPGEQASFIIRNINKKIIPRKLHWSIDVGIAPSANINFI